VPTITSLHLEIARLRRENERLRAQRDALLSQSIESRATGGTVGMQPVSVFMDKGDWDDEIGVAADGNTVFPTIQALKEHSGPGLIEHGIVEVEMRLLRVVEPGTMRLV